MFWNSKSSKDELIEVIKVQAQEIKQLKSSREFGEAQLKTADDKVKEMQCNIDKLNSMLGIERFECNKQLQRKEVYRRALEIYIMER